MTPREIALKCAETCERSDVMDLVEASRRIRAFALTLSAAVPEGREQEISGRALMAKYSPTIRDALLEILRDVRYRLGAKHLPKEQALINDAINLIDPSLPQEKSSEEPK